MAFQVNKYTHPDIKDNDPTIHVLEDGEGNRAEIWPGLGFNCFRWQVSDRGEVFEVLYTDPATFFSGEKPTRSGIPVLFPFPNRIRDGRFHFLGRDYQLPLNDPSGKNAIHGFACRSPWRVLKSGTTDDSAWVTAAFQRSVDAKDAVAHWPAEYSLELTITLEKRCLRLSATVSNHDNVLMPLGLGYHPYFAMPFSPARSAEDCTIQVPARSFWMLDDSLPTGEVRPVEGRLDLNEPRSFANLQVDDILTNLPDAPPRAELVRRARVDGGRAMEMWCSPSFREMVVFTPPHRQAFSVEPYTCTTDAANLQARGVDAGWQELPPRGEWRGVVEFRIVT
jgi:aldose 1-epimerase